MKKTEFQDSDRIVAQDSGRIVVLDSDRVEVLYVTNRVVDGS